LGCSLWDMLHCLVKIGNSLKPQVQLTLSLHCIFNSVKFSCIYSNARFDLA
jgi:hypothetical protein